jgi:putative transcriptional regulator
MEKVNDELDFVKNRLMKDIVGEVVVSDNIEEILRKWRTIFKVSQKALAGELNITSSVISDYESGRRKSPGIKMIKKYIDGIINLDLKGGGEVVKSFMQNTEKQIIPKAITAMREFLIGVGPEIFCRTINADVVVRGNTKDIYGYTVIDSIEAITELPTPELINIYGSNTQRALIFTKVSTGRSPMIAIKLTTLKPSVVVLHGMKGGVDEIAKRIAEAENITLAVCRLENINDVLAKLKEMK